MTSRTYAPNEAAHSDLEVRPPNPGLEAYNPPGPVFYGKEQTLDPNQGLNPTQLHNKPKFRAGGLSNRAFWALIVIAGVIIIAAAVGGGIGGGLSQHNKTAAQEHTSTVSSSVTTSSNVPMSSSLVPSTTINSAQLSLTQEIGPSTTLFRDCPSSNNTIYSAAFGSTDYEFRKLCGMTIVNSGNTNAINQPTSSLDDCIDLCAAWNYNNVTASNGNLLCQAVCWRNSFVNDDHPGSCYGFETTNTSAGFDFVTGDPRETICDSAGWINQA